MFQDLIPSDLRQWAHSPNILLEHSVDQMDSFGLYIKGTMLLSAVKAFNLRYRAKAHAGDSAFLSIESSAGNTSNMDKGPLDRHDPRTTPGFIELDHISSAFVESFPPHLRRPINGNVVDPHLYAACLSPQL